MTPASGRGADRRVAPWRGLSLAAMTVALLAAAGALLPIEPHLLSNQLDASFGATLHAAAARGHASAPSLITTYGPLGFVFYATYDPATYAWLVGIRAALAVATCWALAWFGSNAWRSPWGAVAAVAACTPFFASADVWFLTLPALALILELPERSVPRALQATLGAAIGAAGLIKFTVLLAAAAALLPLALVQLAQRRVPILPVAALLTAVLLWLVLGGGPPAAVSYLDWSVREISMGYSWAMQLPAEPGLTRHAAAAGIAILAAGAALLWRRLRSAGIVLAAAFAVNVFLIFRSGFVRFDPPHVFITVYADTVLAVLLAMAWAQGAGRVAVAIVIVGLGCGGLIAHATRVLGGDPRDDFRAVYPLEAVRRLAAVPDALRGHALAAADARRRAEIRGAFPLPPLTGSVDSYPIDQALLLAHGLDFRPRPVFQSYMAYTPRLAHANAEVLAGESAPQWILFRIAPIDDRLPALDDAPSWPVLLSRYELTGSSGKFAILRRRPTAVPWRLEPLARVETSTGARVPVPSAEGSPIWARVDVHETRRDALAATLFAAPIVRLSVAATDGRSRSHRLVTAIARDGFLLSPIIDTTAHFMNLMSGQPGIQPRALRVHYGGGPSILPGRRQVTVEFFRLVRS